MKPAIVILSDPKNGLEESAGRAFNALSAAYVLRLRKRVRRHGNGNAGGLRTGERQPGTGDSRATESPEADARGIHGT